VSAAAGLDTGLDPVPADTDYRSVRGAAFESPTKYARSAYRNGLPPQLNASSSTGFRLARTVPPSGR
jgi:formylglycine-generating enzyme required for sulfatase activity